MKFCTFDFQTTAFNYRIKLIQTTILSSVTIPLKESLQTHKMVATNTDDISWRQRCRWIYWIWNGKFQFWFKNCLILFIKFEEPRTTFCQMKKFKILMQHQLAFSKKINQIDWKTWPIVFKIACVPLKFSCSIYFLNCI